MQWRPARGDLVGIKKLGMKGIVIEARELNLLRIFTGLKSGTATVLVEGHQHISKDLINLTVIEPCALQVLIPLLEEMEQLETTLDEDEFVESCHCLLRTLTLPERD